jgi:hypothetical protein
MSTVFDLNLEAIRLSGEFASFPPVFDQWIHLAVGRVDAVYTSIIRLQFCENLNQTKFSATFAGSSSDAKRRTKEARE